MLDLYLIQNISNIERFSGNFLFQKENIATHSLEMALLCINFGELVEESSIQELCYRCTIHDLEESISSDVPRPLKWANPELKRLIDETSYQLLSKKVDEKLLNDIKNSKDLTDVNGYLVALADRVQCFMKMSKEVKFYGNKSLEKDLIDFNETIYSWMRDIESKTFMSDKSKINLINYLKQILKLY